MRRFAALTLGALALGTATGLAAPSAADPRILPAWAMGAVPVPAIASAPLPLKYRTANAHVQSAPKVYLDFWGEEWALGWTDISAGSGMHYTSRQAQQYLTDFFNFAGGTSWDQSQTQYCQGVSVGATSCPTSGTHVGNPSGVLGGTWTDTSGAPPAAVVDLGGVSGKVAGHYFNTDQAASEAVNAEQHFGYAADADYFILLPAGVQDAALNARACGYHSDATDASGRDISYTVMLYLPDVYPTGTVSACGDWAVNGSDNSYGNGFFDGLSIVAGHEYAESQTDPQPNAGAAWLDSNNQETGDKCAWIAPGTPGGMHNIGPDANGHSFAVQTLWSNASMACVG